MRLRKGGPRLRYDGLSELRYDGMGAGFGLFSMLGVVFGAIIIISAIMLNSKPHEPQHGAY